MNRQYHLEPNPTRLLRKQPSAQEFIVVLSRIYSDAGLPAREAYESKFSDSRVTVSSAAWAAVTDRTMAVAISAFLIIEYSERRLVGGRGPWHRTACGGR